MARAESKDLLGAVGLMYQALEQPARWEEALLSLADVLDADHLVLDLRSQFEQQTHQIHAARVDPFHLRAFALHSEYAMLRALLRNAPVGLALQQEALIDDRSQRRSAFFADVIRPMGGQHAIVAFPRQGDAGAGPGLLSACRSAHRAPFDARHIEHLQFMLPHIEAALSLRRRLLQSEVDQWWQEQVMQSLPYGMILLGFQGRPCYANLAAEALLSEGSRLSCNVQQGLMTCDAQANRRLHEAVAHALAPLDGNAVEPVRVRSPMGKPDLWLRVMPLPSGGAVYEAWHQARVIVFCDDTTERPIDPQQLSVIFGFTAREAQLAAALLAGEGLAGAARLAGVNIETVRSQLKGVFAKTGTHKQAQLLRVLASAGR